MRALYIVTYIIVFTFQFANIFYQCGSLILFNVNTVPIPQVDVVLFPIKLSQYGQLYGLLVSKPQPCGLIHEGGVTELLLFVSQPVSRESIKCLDEDMFVGVGLPDDRFHSH